jgi:hypothetical protein
MEARTKLGILNIVKKIRQIVSIDGIYHVSDDIEMPN